MDDASGKGERDPRDLEWRLEFADCCSIDPSLPMSYSFRVVYSVSSPRLWLNVVVLTTRYSWRPPL